MLKTHQQAFLNLARLHKDSFGHTVTDNLQAVMFLQGEQWLWWSHPINSPRFTVQNGWRVCEKDAHVTSRLPDASPPASVSWAPCAARNHHPCFNPESVTLENNRTRVSFSLTHEPYRNSQNPLRYWIWSGFHSCCKYLVNLHTKITHSHMQDIYSRSFLSPTSNRSQVCFHNST